MIDMTKKQKTAIVCRSVALFAILFQFRLIAGELVDTAVFTTAVLAGFSAALFLYFFRPLGKSVGAVSAVVIIALVPWTVQFFIALPRLLIPGAGFLAISLDALLLNFNRNNLVSLLPFYWTAASTWFALRGGSVEKGLKFLRAAVIADVTILLVLFSIARTADIEIYRWPIVMVTLFAAIVFLLVIALIFSMPPQTKLRVKEISAAVATLLALIIFSSFFFLGPMQQRAIGRGGGLLEPQMFSFDFTQTLTLESEISMNNDLVFIVRMDGMPSNPLLRRSVMSGYTHREGFFRVEEFDEPTHPLRLPNGRRLFSPPEYRARRQVTQEYFIVNFDGSAFIGMKDPVAISPFETWDASSFRMVYAVDSMVSEAVFANLAASTAGGWPTAAQLGLSPREAELLTYYGDNERLRELAREVTAGRTHYLDKIVAVYTWLKFGDFRYSLRPGIAADGDQLAHFLFNSRRGYCSYFAMAMALMLRSLDIPARVATGFFVDPGSNVFNYFPVRADMAHAWVEVLFPDYGWIEFDPTTEIMSEDEDFEFGAGTDAELFEQLMREILENRHNMVAVEGYHEEEPPSALANLAAYTADLIRNNFAWLFFGALAAVFLFIRCARYVYVYMTKSPRGRSVRLSKHAWRRLALAGFRRGGGNAGLSDSEWAAQADNYIEGSYAMYQAAAAARFAKNYSDDDYKAQRENYARFSASYREKVPLWRRIAAWLCPPLALLLGQSEAAVEAPGGEADGGATPVGAGVAKGGLALLLFFTFALFTNSQTAAQGVPGVQGLQSVDYLGISADELFMEALAAERSEFWERAIDLYRQGIARYPDDPRFPWYLGNLFYGRSLFSLAWEQYRLAESIVPDSPVILTRLGRTASALNWNHVAVDYYERALAINPSSREVINSLGWMYFKVHRLNDGHRLLHSALDQFGASADFSMTLGTIYSAMHNYEQAQYWYMQAISLGQRLGDRSFVSVAWYNLSILETTFHNFGLAFDAASASVRYRDRATGRIALGEMYSRKLDLRQAQREHTAAFEWDGSPLAKLNLAQTYLASGLLEEARVYAHACLGNSDHSWMRNFGIDPNRYLRDVHRVLYRTYQALANAERMTPWSRPSERISSHFRQVSHNFRYRVHRELFHKYALAAADAYGAALMENGDPSISSFMQYFHAFRSHPRRAINYLRSARDLEVAIIPASAATFQLEEGVLTNNLRLIESARAGFDPLWERREIAQSLAEIAKRTRRERSQAAAEELFALNRGALRMAGIALPVDVNISFPVGRSGRNERVFLRALSRAGFDSSPRIDPRFSMYLQINGTAAMGYSIHAEIIDSKGEAEAVRRTFPLQSFARADIYSFVRDFGRVVSRVEI
ncbi:MAG: hypothetical protein FWG66_13240 [Spirochaetes bacterium]|nr:hypothetical protein [Spirochaetota bacterium]